MQLGFLTDGRMGDAQFAARTGYTCLELALFGPTPLFNNHQDFAQELKSEGIALAAVSLFGKNYFDPDTQKVSQHKDLLRRVLDLAAALGAPIVVWGAGSTPSGANLSEQVKVACEFHAPFTEQAHKLGLKPAWYNCHWENVVDRPEAWETAGVDKNKPDGMAIKFDPSHPFQKGRDWKAELLAAGPNLVHAHAKDVLQVGGKFVADPNPGLGSIRWEEFFGILYHVGYNGAVCVEPHSALYTGERRHDFLKFSYSYLSRFIVEGQTTGEANQGY